MTRFVANLLWFLSTLPSALAFAVAARFPAHAQRRVAARLRHAADEPILRRVPTSGSTAATKWIPYTAELLRGFMRAVNPWVCSLYLRHPSLLFASHYWSISPYTETDASPAGEQGSRGFSDDAEYLGSFQQACARVLFPVTPLVKGVKNPERHAWLTLLGLLAAPRLGLISIWHPSAFLRLLERAQRVALAALADRCGGFATAYLQPRSDRRGYQLVCTPVSGARVATVDEVEAELGQNYYYRHTRNLGQLDPVEIVVSPDALADYCRLRHLPPAAAKPPLLL